MACIILKRDSGEERMVRADGSTPYRRLPDERIVGISPNCDGQLKDSKRPIERQSEGIDILAQLDKELGVGPGDWMKRLAAPIARVIGKANCRSCETRRVITNAFTTLKQKHGQAEALKIIAELWKDSFHLPPDEVAKKLREILK